MRPTSGSLGRLLVLLAAMAGMALTGALGHWQLRRAAQKEALVAVHEARVAQGPIDGATLGQGADSAASREGLLHRRMVVQGHWLPAHTVYLENRQMQGRTGFHVLTPLQLGQGGAVVLVQRGWAPRDFQDRTALPGVETPTQEVQVTGLLAPWPSRVYDFGGIEQGPIRQNLGFEAYRRETGLPLLEVSVQQTGDTRDGLLRQWPVVASGADKHYGYAFQWFGLCALIALLYVWFQIVQPRRQALQR